MPRAVKNARCGQSYVSTQFVSNPNILCRTFYERHPIARIGDQRCHTLSVDTSECRRHPKPVRLPKYVLGSDSNRNSQGAPSCQHHFLCLPTPRSVTTWHCHSARSIKPQRELTLATFDKPRKMEAQGTSSQNTSQAAEQILRHFLYSSTVFKLKSSKKYIPDVWNGSKP